MITANYNDYADGGSHKDFEISIVGEQTVIDNSKMLSESIKLQEALCSEQNLRFGACEASQFTVQVANTAGNFKGKTLEVAVTMDEATTKYGTFKVQSDKPTADRIWRVLTAYDTMYDIINADVLGWYSNLTFPMTLANFRNSFFTYLGVTQKSTTLINDSFVIQGGFTATGALSGKTIINAICEFNGVFGHINRDGDFEYISLDGADSFNCPPYENNSVTYEDYVTEAITKVTMKGSSDDVGTSVGTDGNEYIIINNPLIYGTEGTQALVTALTNLLNKISLVTYRPYSLNKTIGNPCVELGDAIVISTKYQTINSYVIKRVLSGIQALRDNYSATGDKTYPKEVNTIQSQINRIAGKTSELSYTVDGLQSTVTSVQQTANTALTRANGSITTDTLHYLATPLSSGVTTETAGWTTTPQSMTTTNKYLWTYHTYTYADAHTSDTTPVITGVYGEDGQQGQTGPQGPAGPTGADGLSITEVTSIYYASNSSTAPSAPSSEVTTTSTSVYNTWTKGVPALTSTYNKLYTCDQVKYSNNTFTWTTPVLNSAITTAVSEIQQLANQIVLKVKSDGTVAKVELGADASTGSNVLIKGDNIQLDGNVTITSGFVLNVGTIQSANYVVDTSGMKITLSDGVYDSKYFKILASGDVIIKSAIIGGANGNDGWSITTGKIESSYTYNNVTNYCGMGTYNNAWAFYVGSTTAGGGNGTFRVGHGGELYATNATILGSITFKDSIKIYDTSKQTTSTLAKLEVYNASGGLPTEYSFQCFYPGTTSAFLTVTSNTVAYFDGISNSANYSGYTWRLAKDVNNPTYSTPSAWGGWSEEGVKLAWYNTANKISNQPSQYGFLLHLGLSYGEGHQIWCTQANGNLLHRGFNSGSTLSSVAFKTILDSSNYTSFITSTLSLNGNQGFRIGNHTLFTDLGTNSACLCADNGSFVRKYSNTNTYNMITASGFANASSRIIKENIKPISEDYAKKILELDTVSFDYIESVGGEKDCVGMIAEDVLNIMPNLVTVPDNYNEEETIEKINNDEFAITMSIDYAKFVPPLIKLVQMQQKQINELKNLIKTEE